MDFEGKFGNPPPIRCTGSLVGMGIGLAGLIVAGVGACLAGFWGHESLIIGCGIALVVIGCLMILGGFGFLFFDYYVRGPRQPRSRLPQRGSPSPHASFEAAPPAPLPSHSPVNLSAGSASLNTSSSRAPTLASSSAAPSVLNDSVHSQPHLREAPPSYSASVTSTTATTKTRTTKLPIDAPIRPPKTNTPTATSPTTAASSSSAQPPPLRPKISRGGTSTAV